MNCTLDNRHVLLSVYKDVEPGGAAIPYILALIDEGDFAGITSEDEIDPILCYLSGRYELDEGNYITEVLRLSFEDVPLLCPTPRMIQFFYDEENLFKEHVFLTIDNDTKTEIERAYSFNE